MTVNVKNNFLANSRGFILQDGGGVSWSIDPTTNKIIASTTGGGPSGEAITSGFGTPTGNSVIANFPGGAATLLQCSETIAEILNVLLAAGLIST